MDRYQYFELVMAVHWKFAQEDTEQNKLIRDREQPPLN